MIHNILQLRPFNEITTPIFFSHIRYCAYLDTLYYFSRFNRCWSPAGLWAWRCEGPHWTLVAGAVTPSGRRQVDSSLAAGWTAKVVRRPRRPFIRLAIPATARGRERSSCVSNPASPWASWFGVASNTASEFTSRASTRRASPIAPASSWESRFSIRS